MVEGNCRGSPTRNLRAEAVDPLGKAWTTYGLQQVVVGVHDTLPTMGPALPSNCWCAAAIFSWLLTFVWQQSENHSGGSFGILTNKLQKQAHSLSLSQPPELDSSHPSTQGTNVALWCAALAVSPPHKLGKPHPPAVWGIALDKPTGFGDRNLHVGIFCCDRA